MNDVSLGLTASIWTKDATHAERIARQLEVGTVYLNRCNEIDPLLPWSGRRGSGNGVAYGHDGFFRLTRPKSLLFQIGT
jgi:acyl-CoA reductase-like NAD-dependent aldehyde dehydrogenase